MAGYENHAGFNITDSKLQVVEVDFVDGQFRLVRIDQVLFDESLDFQNDQDKKIGALLQGAFAKLSANKKFNATKVSFALPFELFLTAQLQYDTSLLYRDLIEEFKWELSILYPFASIPDLVFQYYEVEKNEFIDSNTALVFGINRKYLQLLETFCTKNSLQLNFVDHPHVAADRALSISSSLYSDGFVLNIYIDKANLSLIYSLNGKVISFKTIPLNDLSEITDILNKETEQSALLKIDRSILKNIFISGTAVSSSIIQTLKKTFNCNFVSFNPFDKIRPLPELYENRNYLEHYNSFSAASGIAFRLS